MPTHGSVKRGGRRWRLILALSLALCGTATAALASGNCPGNPEALGTSRTIVVDPAEHPRIGAMSYSESLPLANKELVLTFDDGPIPPSTHKILDILARECVRATFFIVGEMARLHPALVRRAFQEGHTIGTHSMTHPTRFRQLPLEDMKAQIDGGVEATAAALGDPKALAPFVRFPGFGRTDAADDYVHSRGLMVWSHISDKEIVRRALTRLERRGRGILLLHDIHRTTMRALPVLLKELKARGYSIVHVVAASQDHPKTDTAPDAWLVPSRRKTALPVLRLRDVLSGDFLAQHWGNDLCAFNTMATRFSASRQ
jgi:peptidoglycan-N-acetylglucosamine deacetylase